MCTNAEVAPAALQRAGGLREFLTGSWRVDRDLRDLDAGLDGSFTGTATFTDHDDGALRHHECGTLHWPGSKPTRATRELLWRTASSPHSMEVFFPDGRLFHPLNLSTGRDTPVHLCAPDTYRGSFQLDSADAFSYSWQVAGPRKNLLLVTHLRRDND